MRIVIPNECEESYNYKQKADTSMYRLFYVMDLTQL